MTETPRRGSVTVWIHGPKENEWSKEIFEDIGHDDLVRVYLGWAVGSGPGADDMVVHNVVTSEPEDGGQTMRDTQTFPGSSAPPEVDKGQDPIYLGPALTAQARLDGTLYVDRRPHR